MPVYDEDLTNLDEWIRRLKVEYDIFFNGNRKKAPDDLRMRVEKLVKRLAEASDMSFSQRFRYNTLIARFYVYRDLWRRTQQEFESAAEKPQPAETLAPETPVPDANAVPPARGVQISIGDPAAEPEKVQELYRELLRMKGGHAENAPPMTYQRFAEYISSKTSSIRKKYQCTKVVFRITEEDEAIKFTAKAETSVSG